MLQILQEQFGYGAFRERQEDVIRRVLEGRRVLAVFPTGGGKSLCYQLPALILDGVTLVVSPLIALMRDQVVALQQRGIAAARLDSTLSGEEEELVFSRLVSGELKLLYLSPERLGSDRFRKRFRGIQVAMVAVDEAHCISEWGHNFRPDYLSLARHCRSLKAARVLALTATATPAVARDIRRQFRIAKDDCIRSGFHRPNLELRVTACGADERKEYLVKRLDETEGPVVVYVTRQETAEEVATYLTNHGYPAQAYHAGLRDDFREEIQRAFMAGETRIVVATIAFGMGIDKQDIRAVVHYNLPKSLEGYAQETGRAGRDGGPAVCEMFACGNDLAVLENFIFADTPSLRALGNLLDRVLRLGKAFDVSVHDLSVSCDIRKTVVATVLAYLEADGFIAETGRFHATYRLKLLAAQERMLAGRTQSDRRFLKRLLEKGVAGRSWLVFDVETIAADTRVPRNKIIGALRDLEAAGEAALAVSDARRGYRLLKEPGSLGVLVEQYNERFVRREAADLERLQQVIRMVSHRGCLTAYLARHFGETMIEPCGHCDRCRGLRASGIRRPTSRDVTMDERERVQQLVRERHPALSSPRQMARFLCGMTSPATTKARLAGHPAFGMWADVGFREVLSIMSA